LYCRTGWQQPWSSAGFWPWLLVWWWIFIKQHLRISHAFVTTLLMMVQAVLVVIIAGALMAI
jgi:hypothetical protein